MTVTIRRLGPGDATGMRALNDLFAREFEDPESYGRAPPGTGYLERILGRDTVIVLVAEDGGAVVAGLVAYVLDKLEQERSEIYIYDLAVAQSHRRQRVASSLIGRLQRIAADIGAWVIFVQADHGDEPAISLYSKLGVREDVMHFDIAPAATT